MVSLLWQCLFVFVMLNIPRYMVGKEPEEVLITNPRLPLEYRGKLLRVINAQSLNNVISFTLYGNYPRYINGALRNSELVKRIYPGWVCRYYHDKSVDPEILHKLKEMGSELVDVTETELQNEVDAKFWRFFVAADKKIDRFIVRDVDRLLDDRDAYAVNEWIKSGLSVHSIRDRDNIDYKLHGAMWGAKKGAMSGDLVNMFSQMGLWECQDSMTDTRFLSSLWPFIMENTLSHAKNCGKYLNCKPF